MNKEKEVEAYLKGVLPEEQKLKYEIAQELGILDKVLAPASASRWRGPCSGQDSPVPAR